MQRAHFVDRVVENKTKVEGADIYADCEPSAAQPNQWFVSTGDSVGCWRGE